MGEKIKVSIPANLIRELRECGIQCKNCGEMFAAGMKVSCKGEIVCNCCGEVSQVVMYDWDTGEMIRNGRIR